MTKSVKKLRAAAIGSAIVLLTGSLVGSQLVPLFSGKGVGETLASAEGTPLVSEVKGSVDTKLRENFDRSAVQKLADTLGADREVSVIVKTQDEGLLDAYGAQSSLSRYGSVAEYAGSAKGGEVLGSISRSNDEAKHILQGAGVKYRIGADYNVLLGGFEVVVKAGDCEKLLSAFSGSRFEASLSEEYLPAESQLVENDVNVYETGIFKNDSKYDGSGTVIAVLDTGLDYTHSAFDEDSFTSKSPVIDQAYIDARVSELTAKTYTPSLTAANVYLSKKVPYAYDYADKDTDVYPLESEHGTHVSGIIVGKDGVVQGIAPNAQLASMKVFSDTTQGARWSWILSALEDCVVLDVDVINMSLGTSCGFTVETESNEQEVYDKVAEHGISLVAAASNDYNSTFGSEKNGNLGLTTNPDSATVGSPGTYESALSVASISGVKTPYLLFGDEIIYFTESANQASEPRHFVKDLFASEDFKAIYGEITDPNAKVEVEYVRVPGIGRSADYNTIDVKGKIALVHRGQTTFEEKARIADNKGAIGVIIYNDVSGDITMNVGSVGAPVCSISQDNGETLAAFESGKITVSLGQEAGPFMSDFSSWGPTPDLRIKPEITAHGGDILSSVPGQDYDRLSGTSMASPNQAGVTALVRQYVKETFQDIANDPVKVKARVNQLMMSTADIARNTNGLPYSVRKQGAGLANLTKATTSPAYISTFARSDEAVANQAADRFTDEVMDKAKIEYGDKKNADEDREYLLKFAVNNTSQNSLTYNVGAIVMTEGVSETKTGHGEQVVTEEGYLLSPEVRLVSVDANGSKNENAVTVPAGKSATVVVSITLSDADVAYLESVSGRTDADGNAIPVFANGMYLEGFVTLTVPGSKEAALNVPYLAFYGDWTQAPVFDLEYFETDKDANDDSIDLDDKTMADAYATRPLGGLYGDYISYLGSYYFVQDPSTPQITADRKYISLTNQEGDEGGINHIYGIYAGMLRGAKSVVMTVTDTTTGEVVWTKTEYNQRKSYSAGSTIYPSTIDVDFHVADYDLKNNTQYLFKAEAFLDYPGEQNNKRSTFEFPFVTDFQAPVVTDAEFYTEYDSSAQKDRLYARLYVYDNHYTMSASIGQLKYSDPGSEFTYTLDTFTRYFTQVHSEFNSVSAVTFELTDYIDKLADSVNKNTFSVALTDYALNQGVYEIRVPDSVRYLYFPEMQDLEEQGKQYGLTLSPNETYTLSPEVYPATEWKDTLTYESSAPDVVKVVAGKLLALKSGDATITARSAMQSSISATLTVHVLAQGDPDYEYYDKPDVEKFVLKGYYADRAFYFMSNADRDIGLEGYVTLFSPNQTSYSLSMFPSEKVTLRYELTAYEPEKTKVIFESGNTNIVEVSENGQITAIAEGFSTVSVRVMIVNEDGSLSGTLSDKSIVIEVKEPYEQNGPYLFAYRGGGGKDGVVSVPESYGFTEVYQYAFTGYDYIPKDLEAGDEISEEDPSYSKIWYYGENQDVTTVILPEGIEVIGNYAFAGMEGLQEVYLPSTIKKIAAGAFYGCKNLKNVHGLENVKFINQSAFSGPAVVNANGTVTGYDAPKLTSLTADSLAGIIAVGDKAFQGSGITEINLPASAQSIGAYAFADTNLMSVRVRASKIKLGAYAFLDCQFLSNITVNASVIPEGVFAGCTSLTEVTLGKDVERIEANAFASTQVSSFTVRSGNSHFKQSGKTPYILSADGTRLVCVAPVTGNTFSLSGDDANTVTTVGEGAFSGHASLRTVTLPNVSHVEKYAFYGCTSLTTARFAQGGLEEIGERAFVGCGLRTLPTFAQSLEEIGPYAFYASDVTSVKIPKGVKVGEGAFFATALTSLTIEDDAVIGAGAFQAYGELGYYYLDSSRQYVYSRIASDSKLSEITIGKNVEIGNYAFAYQTALTKVTLGENAVIGEGAFYTSGDIRATMSSSGGISVSFGSNFEIDLSKAKSIGAGAFTGEMSTAYKLSGNSLYLVGDLTAQAPRIRTADLSAAESLGQSAFAYAAGLTSVTLGNAIAEIPDLAFAETGLTSIDLKNVKTVGAGAFLGTPLRTVDLSKVDTVGMAAFAQNAALTGVTLKAGATVEDRAFFADYALTSAAGLDKVVSIGAGAFAGTGLTGLLDISSAYSLGDFAFMATNITGAKLSEDLYNAERLEGETDEAYKARVFLGENPFAGCPLTPFSATEDEIFNGQVVGTQTTDTYDLNGRVKVIGGALYKVLDNGKYVLVTYPLASDKTDYTVAEGTVRISAEAFLGSRLVSVTLPESLLAIGDMAFYGCGNLSLVTFKSMNAPILEEQYDEDYAALPQLDASGQPVVEDGKLVTNLPATPAWQIFPSFGDTTDLGIIKYATMSFDPANFFYGANFVDRIGHMKPSLTMVRPSNGVCYDSFIFAQYFGTQIMGAVAPSAETLAAIEAIKALPAAAAITKADKDQIERALALYNAIATTEQQALVQGSYDGNNYYETLTNAVSILNYILAQEKPGEDEPGTPPADNKKGCGGCGGSVLGYGTVGVVAAVSLALACVTVIRRRKDGDK